jgi:hypothetical protein
MDKPDKPDVDFIEGLSPALSIDQKTASHNPRSTVEAVTEISDYLRLLYACIGLSHSPNYVGGECRPTVKGCERATRTRFPRRLYGPEGQGGRGVWRYRAGMRWNA